MRNVDSLSDMIKSEQTGTITNATLDNVSLNGICFASDEAFATGNNVIASIDVHDGGKPIMLFATIIHVNQHDDAAYYGCRIDRISDNDRWKNYIGRF